MSRSKTTKRIIDETPQSVKDWVKKYVTLKSMKTETDSVDVRIMKTVAQFDYLVKRNEQLTIDELRNRAQFCPGIMEEPELQELVQIAKDSTISSVFKNSMGLWWNFKQ